MNDDANVIARRRERVLAECPEGLVLVRGSGPEGTNPNFYYLTGVAEPSGVLLMSSQGFRIGTGRSNPGPDYVRGHMAREVLFLPSTDPMAARWGEDSAATVDSVDAGASGFDAVLPAGQLEGILPTALSRSAALTFVRGFTPGLAGPDDPDSSFLGLAARRFVHLELHDGTPTVHEMRRLKDAGEVERIEKSVAVTAEAMDRVMWAVRPGMREFEMEAEIVAVYRSHGASHAFDPIVGSGKNALSLHYTSNDGTIGEGELLLIDSGARLAGYNADVTRTIPVDGKFTSRQREVYEVVLDALVKATAQCRPGALLGDIHAIAYDAIEAAGLGRYFVHGVGHHLGLETHDVGDVYRPLAPGAVVTIEPGVYLPEEGIGIRIEDDVLVTERDPRVLTEAIPKTVDDVERRMQGSPA